MTLNEFAGGLRTRLFEELKAGQEPSLGAFDPSQLRDARAKGSPQVGATRYTPDSIAFEFVYPDPTSTAAIVTVHVPAPERIVFLPVPPWVVENIWQGDVDGSFHFESDALELLEAFASKLQPAENAVFFGPREPKRRE